MNCRTGFSRYKWVSILLVGFLLGCSTRTHYAPVVDISDLGVFIQKKSISRIAVRQNVTTRWRWPAEGRVVATFSGSTKGIDIAGYFGEPIVASAAGTVMYAGNGLRGYGYLIIIKHNNTYLSAYAYNKSTCVRSGQRVKQGQKIAEMGKNRTGDVVVHFEIRRYGQPIDPLTLLKG